MGKDIEIPANIEEVNEKSEELKIKFDKGEISREEYETENRKLKNQKRWLELCLERNKIKEEISICEKMQQKVDNSKEPKSDKKPDKKSITLFLVLFCVLFLAVQILSRFLNLKIKGIENLVAPAYIIVVICLFLLVIYFLIRRQFNKIKIKKLKKELSKLNDVKSMLDQEAICFYFDCQGTSESHPGTNLDDIIALVGVKYEKKRFVVGKRILL